MPTPSENHFDPQRWAQIRADLVGWLSADAAVAYIEQWYRRQGDRYQWDSPDALRALTVLVANHLEQSILSCGWWVCGAQTRRVLHGDITVPMDAHHDIGAGAMVVLQPDLDSGTMGPVAVSWVRTQPRTPGLVTSIIVGWSRSPDPQVSPLVPSDIVVVDADERVGWLDAETVAANDTVFLADWAAAVIERAEISSVRHDQHDDPAIWELA